MTMLLGHVHFFSKITTQVVSGQPIYSEACWTCIHSVCCTTKPVMKPGSGTIIEELWRPRSIRWTLHMFAVMLYTVLRWLVNMYFPDRPGKLHSYFTLTSATIASTLHQASKLANFALIQHFHLITQKFQIDNGSSSKFSGRHKRASPGITWKCEDTLLNHILIESTWFMDSVSMLACQEWL